MRRVEQPAVPYDPGAFQMMVADRWREPVHFAIGSQCAGDGNPIAEDRIEMRQAEEDRGYYGGDRGGEPPGFAMRDEDRREGRYVGEIGDDQPLIWSQAHFLKGSHAERSRRLKPSLQAEACATKLLRGFCAVVAE